MLLRALGSPWVVGPFMAGMTGFAAALAMGWRLGLGLFAALAGSLAAVGALVTRLVLGGERLARQILEETTDQETRQRQSALDDLDRHLAESDDDPRPETALRDLRALQKAFEDAESTVAPTQLASLVEIRSRVNQLFHQCVHSLEQTQRLWTTARQLQTPAARQPLLEQRERLLADVQTTVRQLSTALVGLQGLGSGEGSSHELRRLRDELDQSLEVARTVEERVAALLNDSADPTRPGLWSATPETKG